LHKEKKDWDLWIVYLARLVFDYLNFSQQNNQSIGYVNWISCTVKIKKEDSGIIKLTSSNYFLWKAMMEDHLYCNDLALPLECKEIKHDEMHEARWNELNKKAAANVRK